jgi:hypothetical protein
MYTQCRCEHFVSGGGGGGGGGGVPYPPNIFYDTDSISLSCLIMRCSLDYTIIACKIETYFHPFVRINYHYSLTKMISFESVLGFHIIAVLGVLKWLSKQCNARLPHCIFVSLFLTSCSMRSIFTNFCCMPYMACNYHIA